MKYKVCILSAGVGSRMMPLTGSLNKSLLPVNFKAVISHIIEKFDKDIEIVIAVGHLKETVLNYLECAHKNRNFTIVEVDRYTGKGSGPGYSLMQCRDYLKSPFIFFSSDTLVVEDIPLPYQNWLGISQVKESKIYCSVRIKDKTIFSLDDKTVNENKNAFIGLAGIKDYDIFFQALQENKKLKEDELQVSNGFESLLKHNLSPHNFTWYDTGNMEGYINANKIISSTSADFDFSKTNEFLYFVEDKVIKFFADNKIIENRFKRSQLLSNLCPKINFIKGNFYSYSKVPGKVLYDVVDKKVMDRLLVWLDVNLWNKIEIKKSMAKNFESACLSFYYEKTMLRLEAYHQKYATNDVASTINGVAVPSLSDMFKVIDWNNMSSGLASKFHGDLQFDNILLKENGDFLLLDWRQDFGGIVEYGDQYYDLAKLNGGLGVSYKLIKNGSFSFQEYEKNNYCISHTIPRELELARSSLYNFIDKRDIDKSKVKILTSLIYLNMSPMHNAPFDHFIYNFGKLALFENLSDNFK